MRQVYIAIYYLFLLSGISVLINGNAMAQNEMLQVRVLDSQLNTRGEMTLTINGRQTVSIGSDGSAFLEMVSSELPINSIQTDQPSFEVASWTLNKGILEVIVRKKNYQTVNLTTLDTNDQPLEGVDLVYLGSKNVRITTNGSGEASFNIPLQESVSSLSQFYAEGYRIIDLRKETGNINLTLRSVQARRNTGATAQEQEVAVDINSDYFKNFDITKIDSIQSLTAFYAIFKNYQIEDLDEAMQLRIDAKFNELIGRLQDSSTNNNAVSFMRNISDTTYLQQDISNLLSQAVQEGRTLDQQREDFEQKVSLMGRKLENGLSNISESEREALLAELRLLEKTLAENEDRFYKNQNTYRQIIDDIAERYFDMEDLEGRLYQSETQRLEEKRIFRGRLIAALIALGLFAIMTVLLIYFSDKLKKQKKKLVKVNEEIQRMNENLEHIVYERTKLLEETNRELDTVLYRASHDLRSPIRTIIGLCNIAEMYPSSSPEELFHQMKLTTISMDKLLKKLSMISEVNQPGEARQVDVCHMMAQVEKEFSTLVNEYGIKFKVECQQGLKMYSVPNLLYVILTNLVENAIFFSVLKNSSDYQVMLTATEHEGGTEFTIYDNGVGVDETINDKLFDMFFRGHEYSKGNGLGLFIVQKCVHALNGSIKVESSQGEYAKFTVILPEYPWAGYSTVPNTSANTSTPA